MDYRGSTLKSLLKIADRLSAKVTLIVGDDEVSKGILIMRDMETKKQEEVLMSSAPDRVKSWMKQHDLLAMIS